MKQTLKRYVITILANNRPRLITKICGLFDRKGFNLESISAGRVRGKDMVRMSICVNSVRRSGQQLKKYLYKFPEVMNVSEAKIDSDIIRELILIKLKSCKSQSKMIQLLRIFNAKFIDGNSNHYIIELCNECNNIDKFINAFNKDCILEITGSGIVAIKRLKKRRS